MPRFVTVAKADSIQPGQMIKVEIDNLPVAIANVGGSRAGSPKSCDWMMRPRPYPPGSPSQTFSGEELVGILARVEEYRRHGTADPTMHNTVGGPRADGPRHTVAALARAGVPPAG